PVNPKGWFALFFGGDTKKTQILSQNGGERRKIRPFDRQLGAILEIRVIYQEKNVKIPEPCETQP
ncbi:MAG: hypothetical protein WCH85_05405, partial [Methanomicrobiales archaeon]